MNIVQKVRALLNGETTVTVITKSWRFRVAHILAKANVKEIGDYRVALSYYLKMIVVDASSQQDKPVK